MTDAMGLVWPDWYGIVLTVDMTDSDLLELMTGMRRVRLGGQAAGIVCSIHGFNDDPREVWDIPDVRSFCRRLVDIGFISDLDLAPHWDPRMRDAPGQGGGLGAIEIWLISEGRFGHTLQLTPRIYDEALVVVGRANGRADELLRGSDQA